MIFRRFHRTAGPPLLLALLGISAAIIVPRLNRSITHELSFVGMAESTNQQSFALFLLPEHAPPHRFLNVTSFDRQFATVFIKDAHGNESENIQGSLKRDHLPNGKERLWVPVPTTSSAFHIVHSIRVRRGRAIASNPPRILFMFPWGRVHQFKSDWITTSNVSVTWPEPQ